MTTFYVGQKVIIKKSGNTYTYSGDGSIGVVTRESTDSEDSVSIKFSKLCPYDSRNIPSAADRLGEATWPIYKGFVYLLDDSHPSYATPILWKITCLHYKQEFYQSRKGQLPYWDLSKPKEL